MKIKLDENLRKSALVLLRGAGYEAERPLEEGLSGYPDEQIWDFVLNQGMFFITLDVDFSDVRKFPPGTHPGILVLRLSKQGREVVKQTVSKIIKEYTLETLKGSLAIADEYRTRIRRPKG